jgi:hypothetical protein
MITRNAKGKGKDLEKELEEIRQLNKKNHQAQRQQEEEDSKRLQDDGQGLNLEADNDGKPADLEPFFDKTLLNFTNEVHNIMSGVQDMETSDTEKDNEEELRSPVKKRSGSSKSTSRRKSGARQVSPPETGQATASAARTTTFLDTFHHPFSRIILELAVVLKSDKAFEEFIQALMSFLTNAQMVDPKFVINPLNPNSKEKNIMSKGEISPNLTKLGAHIKISGNGNVFNKQKVWNRDDPDERSSRKGNKKEEFRDPTVYFSMIVSSEIPPSEIIERTTHEWARLNGVRLQVKELQFVDSETVVTFYKVSKLTPKAVILAELKKILLMTQEKAREENLDEETYDFSMDIDVGLEESLPAMTLRVVQAKLKGEQVATFNKLNNRAQYARKTWHLEVASKYSQKMKALVQMAKEYGFFEYYWGPHAHISEVTDVTSTSGEAKRQVETAQKHVNYEVSMTAEDLLGVIDLDHFTDVKHPESGRVLAQYSLRHVLFHYIKMNDGCPAIAEAHQQDISMPTHLIIPNTPEAERLVEMMNKNLPAFLQYTLKEQGLPDGFITDLLKNSCEASMLAEMSRCTWDAKTRTLTTAEESMRKEKTKAFENAAWFKDEFGLLGQRGRNQKQYTAPEVLFDLADEGSRKTIHDRHRETTTNTRKDDVGTPPRLSRKGGEVDLTTSDGDSTSHTSSASSEDLRSSDEGSHSNASSDGEGDDTGAAGRG